MTITNKEFLVGLLGEADTWDEGGAFPFLSQLPGDPTGGPFGFSSLSECKKDRNNFFCISRFKPAGPDKRFNRVNENWHSLHALVVDDVGTKVKRRKVLKLLGDPSYILETSPSCFHWGYFFDKPVTKVKLAYALCQGLFENFGIADMAGVNRILRLPVGINNKPKHLDKGGNPFTCVLHTWKPTQRITAKFAKKALKANPTAVIMPGAGGDALPLVDDPVYEVLHSRGLVQKVQTGDMKVDIVCPWSHKHTDADTSGSTYMRPAGYKCHHGHCAKKTFRDLREYLGIAAVVIDAVKAKATAIREFGAKNSGNYMEVEEPLATEEPKPKKKKKKKKEKKKTKPAEEALPAPRIDEQALRAKKRLIKEFSGDIRDLYDFERNELVELPPREWLFKDLVLSNSVWLLSGEGGVGKSRLLLPLAIAVATGRAFGPFSPEEQGAVLILSKEDDRQEVARRIQAQYNAGNCLMDPSNEQQEWTEEDNENLFGNIVVPRDVDNLTLASESVLLECVYEAAKHRLKRTGKAFSLVVVDPLGHFWDYGDNDSTGINSTRGAFVNVEALKALQCAASGAAPGTPLEDRPRPSSVVSVHHLNKMGGVTGSRQIVDYHRAAFGLFKTEAARATIVKLVLSKANYTARQGFSWRFELQMSEQSVIDGYDGAMWPADTAGEMLTRVEIAVKTVEALGESVSAKALVGSLQADAGISRKAARGVVDHLKELDEDELEELGLVRSGTTKISFEFIEAPEE